MTRLTEALRALGLEGELALSGRWVTLQGELTKVFMTEGPWDTGYYTWCDHPGERAIEAYRDPLEAIRAGARTVASPGERERDADSGDYPACESSALGSVIRRKGAGSRYEHAVQT